MMQVSLSSTELVTSIVPETVAPLAGVKITGMARWQPVSFRVDGSRAATVEVDLYGERGRTAIGRRCRGRAGGARTGSGLAGRRAHHERQPPAHRPWPPHGR